MFSEPIGKKSGFFFRESLELIEEFEFLTFFFGILLNLFSLSLKFRLVRFPLRLCRKISTGAHRKCACEHAGKSAD